MQARDHFATSSQQAPCIALAAPENALLVASSTCSACTADSGQEQIRDHHEEFTGVLAIALDRIAEA